MKYLITFFVVVLLIYGGYQAFLMWDHYDTNKDLEKTQTALDPRSLPGMPLELEESYKKAEDGGAASLQKWLKLNGLRLQDPRRAWIELQYMVLISHDQPAEAKVLFAEIKARTPKDSPVYPRIKQLEKTYE